MDERILYEQKWFDYRIIPHTLANYVFLLEYILAYQNYQNRRTGCKYYNPLSWKTRKKNKETGKFESTSHSTPICWVEQEWPNWNALVHLRQQADALCMHYADFWKHGFQVVNDMKFRFLSLGLFKRKDVLRSIVERETTSSNEIKTSKLSFYSSENYSGYESQKDYFWHIYNSIKRKYGTRYVDILLTAVDEGMMSMEFLQENAREFKLGG